MSYSSFRKQNNDINSLKEKFDRLNGKRTFESDFDETYWSHKHVAGDGGTGEAILRFLPAPPDGNGGQEPDNIVKYFQFSINKNGKYYINRGRNTLSRDEPDPANDHNMAIWARKDITKDEKKKLLINRAEYFIANIYVVKDPNQPENEGKVFRWNFGKMVYNMINAQLFPQFETDEAVNVFDPIEGADFVFRVTQKGIPDRITGELRQVPTYENSKFLNPKQRWSLDDFDAIWEQEHTLQSEIAPDKFKSYEDLKQQFDRVMETAQNFLDSDEPIAKATKPKEKTAPVKEHKPVPDQKEPLEDEIPWDVEEDEDKEEKSTSSDSNELDADDWFAQIGK